MLPNIISVVKNKKHTMLPNLISVVKKKKQLDSDREARHSRYHDAVLRGRNPKSFQHKDDPMWDSVYVDMLRFSRGTNRVEK